MNQRMGLDTRANLTEWARLVSPSPKPAAAGVALGKVYGDSTKPGVCDRLDALPEGRARGRALNADASPRTVARSVTQAKRDTLEPDG